jgi:hypothetical protein
MNGIEDNSGTYLYLIEGKQVLKVLPSRKSTIDLIELHFSLAV